MRWVDRHRQTSLASCMVCPGLNLSRALSTGATNEGRVIAVQKPVAPDSNDRTRALLSLQTLRAILAGKRPFDASALCAAYSISKPQLTYLTSSEFSTLIALFGALSKYSDASLLPSTPTFSLSPNQHSLLVKAPVEDFNRLWWDVVLKLGVDQTALGRRTADVDRYWIMLARLGCCFRSRIYHHDTSQSHTRNQGKYFVWYRLI
jgi:hypothetical protein